ncbi:glycosyltransferase family 2 protein [Photobacterium leiognathi]|uniref:glycosyltransferase family 2 protein n=1 Tax=Photobacterium leiognathi TaxID=553611 RepID=UPI002982AE75|nr:glycosyltransferase [Photobacterium leiognathi]
MITVLLPAYNAEKYIHRAINSILNQTFTNFELIIINDGSTDLTRKIVENYTDQRIRLINIQNNIGLINALNLGLNLANRKYIARLDADDICLPTRFEKQIEFLEKNSEYVACGTGIINFNETSESYMQYPETDEEIRVALHFFERNICHPTVMIRTSALNKHNIRYRKEYKYAEDYKLWIELSKIGKLHNLKDGLVKYHRHQNQVSVKYYPQQIAISREIVTELLYSIWPNILMDEIESVLQLCVHEQGMFPEKHLSLKQIEVTIDKILSKNKYHNTFNSKLLKNILYFKKFRCSFYYIYPLNYFAKLYCFITYFKTQPSRAFNELIQLLMMLKIKEIKDK